MASVGIIIFGVMQRKNGVVWTVRRCGETAALHPDGVDYFKRVSVVKYGVSMYIYSTGTLCICIPSHSQAGERREVAS